MTHRWASGWDGVRINRDIWLNGPGFHYGLLVGVNRGRLRLRYPKGTQSKVQYLDDAGGDLKALAMLWIGQLLPAGVLADKLEEDHPQHAEAATILRLYDDIRREMEEAEQVAKLEKPT